MPVIDCPDAGETLVVAPASAVLFMADADEGQFNYLQIEDEFCSVEWRGFLGLFGVVCTLLGFRPYRMSLRELESARCSYFGYDGLNLRLPFDMETALKTALMCEPRIFSILFPNIEEA